MASTRHSIVHSALVSLAFASACGDDGSTGTGDGSTGGADSTSTGTTIPDPTAASVDSTGPGPATSSTGEPTTTGVDTTAGEDSTSSGSSGGSEDTTTGGALMCAGMSFDMLTSTENDLVTNLDVAGAVSCNQDITVTASGGTVCVADDGAGAYWYTVETIALLDVPPVMCGLATVEITSMSIENDGDFMEVVVDQAGGMLMGNQSVQVMGTVEGTALGNPIPATPLMDFTGVLPEGDAAFGAGDTTMTYADTMTVIATAMPEVLPGIAVTVTLTGLTGSLTFAM